MNDKHTDSASSSANAQERILSAAGSLFAFSHPVEKMPASDAVSSTEASDPALAFNIFCFMNWPRNSRELIKLSLSRSFHSRVKPEA